MTELPGHRRNISEFPCAGPTRGAEALPGKQTYKFDALLKSLAEYDTVASGQPPSLSQPVDRHDLLNVLVCIHLFTFRIYHLRRVFRKPRKAKSFTHL